MQYITRRMLVNAGACSGGIERNWDKNGLGKRFELTEENVRALFKKCPNLNVYWLCYSPNISPHIFDQLCAIEKKYVRLENRARNAYSRRNGSYPSYSDKFLKADDAREQRRVQEITINVLLPFLLKQNKLSTLTH